MLKAAVIPVTQKIVKPISRRKDPRANARNQQQHRSDGHGEEQFDLVVQQAAIIEDSH
jgi:hypothetical protein